VVLSRAFLDDPRLSLRAKGLLAFLLSRGGEQDVDSLGVGGDRARGVESAFRELECAGYFVRSSGSGDALAGMVRETSRLPLLASRPRRARMAGEGAADNSERARAEAEAGERILVRLNELRAANWTWAKYTPLSSKHKKTVEHIRGRLRDGYSAEDLVLVLEYLASVDGGKDSSRRYFDSVTPFNTKNFERNLTLAVDWEERGKPPGDESLSRQRADGHDPAIYEKRVKGGDT